MKEYKSILGIQFSGKLLKRTKIQGIEELIPVQLRPVLWLMVNDKELGTTSDVYNELADIMLEYSLRLRGFKRSCESYRYLRISLL